MLRNEEVICIRPPSGMMSQNKKNSLNDRTYEIRVYELSIGKLLL